jgi:hypothetical protein
VDEIEKERLGEVKG